MSEPSKVFLGLGSNLGQRLSNLRDAVRRVSETSGIRVEAASPVYESEAHIRATDPRLADFLNLVIQIETEYAPLSLLDTILAIEGAAGRHREEGTWLPRTIDIDILVFADQVIDSERLKVPHPRMSERRFVLRPFADLAPDAWVPEPFSMTVSALLRICPDQKKITYRYPAHAVFDEEVTGHEGG